MDGGLKTTTTFVENRLLRERAFIVIVQRVTERPNVERPNSLSGPKMSVDGNMRAGEPLDGQPPRKSPH